MATRRKFSASFKAKVAMEAMKEQATLAELSHKYEVSVSQISQWKHEAISNMDKIFGERAERESFDKDLQIQRLQSSMQKWHETQSAQSSGTTKYPCTRTDESVP